MLKTNENQAFSFSYDSTADSTVYVSPGVTQLGGTGGPYIMPFRGGSISFNGMTDFSSVSNIYQYSALSICNFGSYTTPDLTSTTSTRFDSTLAPAYPSLGDATIIHPIGLFLFYRRGTSDGTTTELLSALKVN